MLCDNLISYLILYNLLFNLMLSHIWKGIPDISYRRICFTKHFSKQISAPLENLLNQRSHSRSSIKQARTMKVKLKKVAPPT
jgi:hypothetical protein